MSVHDNLTILVAWSLADYAQALLCFEKANDEKNTTTARGKLAEEEGRISEARGDEEGSRRHFQAAIDYFLTVDLVREAVQIHTRLGRFYDAAG